MHVHLENNVLEGLVHGVALVNDFGLGRLANRLLVRSLVVPFLFRGLQQILDGNVRGEKQESKGRFPCSAQKHDVPQDDSNRGPPF